MTHDVGFRVGDVLSVACPFTETRVEGLAWDYLTGYDIHPDDGIPFTFDLLFRPFAFLRPGDEVADAAGRAWRFDGPWDWHAFDGAAAPEGPEWPLTLLTRAGAPCVPEAAAAVAGATTTGSHQETLRHWTRLTDATPTPP
ncbi:hypothetical protein AB0D27_37765 [Streptomyces sp. NPDC048415]|jgi:hypothetical protein|uniref:hypothetical protein n=1 Tax=Streptomyces sp. NPDC048415 TaxID=3154822 RepID=UPI00342CDA7F